MPAPSESTTLVPLKERRTTGGRGTTFGLPPDVVTQSAARLRIISLLYAFVFAMAGYVPALFIPEDRAHLFSSFIHWGPGAIAITVALLVSVVMRSPRLEPPIVMSIALVFEIVSSYGIATAEFHEAALSVEGYFGLSWVAVWTLLFTVVIPTPPRRALVAALASVSAVPVVVAIVLSVHPVPDGPNARQFFQALVFPYLLVVIMAYVGARVVYALGTEVSRARELGSYRLIERLGQGGMGEVWRAKHRLLARPAAIKLIRPAAATHAHGGTVPDAARQRFEREAQVTASLRSPHTVDLFDFGVADDGTFYYVMELLDGLDVDTLVRRTGPVPAERAIHIVKQICHSLAEAEAHGLVHRDIKPANIFIARYGEDYDFVKVLDFGIVKASADDKAETIPALTVENTIQGTPAFIAPEQALGGSKIDGRADIYATGCVAYWLLTGELVFTADTPLGLVMHHVNTAPTAPSGRTELPIPPDLDRIVLSCLAKDPAERPQTAKELASRLASVDIGARWTDDRARLWWETYRPVN